MIDLWCVVSPLEKVEVFDDQLSAENYARLMGGCRVVRYVPMDFVLACIACTPWPVDALGEEEIYTKSLKERLGSCGVSRGW